MTIQREGGRIYVRGPIIVDNVVKITRQGFVLLDDNDLVVDMGGVTEVDSSAISMLFEWLRLSHARKHQLHFVNLPANLSSLVGLYGVMDFIPLDKSTQK